ncbi:MAG: type II secretion system protein [Candidatus Ryanbacteria bacterium]|nr:type II secretion system protein [Candidatus Ryanbacteria bacterium]
MTLFTVHRGFTLIEMIVVITILSILFGLGIQGFLSLRGRTNLEGAVRDIETALTEARNRAMTSEGIIDQDQADIALIKQTRKYGVQFINVSANGLTSGMFRLCRDPINTSPYTTCNTVMREFTLPKNISFCYGSVGGGYHDYRETRTSSSNPPRWPLFIFTSVTGAFENFSGGADNGVIYRVGSIIIFDSQKVSDPCAIDYSSSRRDVINACLAARTCRAISVSPTGNIFERMANDNLLVL